MPARIVCFGELLLRLAAPGRQLLLQSPQLDVHVGGAEANVAVSLAAFGHDAALVGHVPGNALGRAAVAEMRRYGVGTGAVVAAEGRMGLYFLTQGAMHRPSEVVYDRAGSAFALAAPEAYDWPRLLAGADWLHLSGVTPALGENAATAAIDAARCARRLGVKVCFDGNFRPTLWQASQGDAPAILQRIIAEADLLLADYRDISVVLGAEFPQQTPEARLAAAAAAAFAAFPNLRRLASTVRRPHSVDQHALSALMLTRDGGQHQTPAMALNAIVDRIGAGDAFAAGILHGLLSGMDDARSLAFGLGAAALKHSVPGDFSPLGTGEVEALLAEARFDVRR